MPQFDIEIIETLNGVFTFEAENLDEALAMAKDRYTDGEIVLDGYSNSNCDYEIKAV